MLKQAFDCAARSGTDVALKFDERFEVAAKWEFGLLDSIDMKTSQDRREKAAEALRVGYYVFRDDDRYERFLMESIAQAIESFSVQPLDSAPFLYVDRPRLDVHYNELVSTPEDEWHWQTKRRICIVGEPGVGKTWYAKHLAANFDSVWIDAGDPESMDSSIAKALEKYGAKASGGRVVRHINFVELLQRSNGPQLVILDNVAHPQEIDNILSAPTNAWIISTSQVKPPINWAPALEVGSLEDNEALELMKRICPDINLEDCEGLTRILGGRAIAIAQVCTYVSTSSEITMGELLDTLERDTVLSMEVAAERVEAALSSVYGKIIRRLTKESPTSIRLLEMLAFGAPARVPEKVAAAYLVAARPPTNQTHAKVAYLRAIAPLRELCLVEKGENGLYSHVLTRRLLRGLITSKRSRRNVLETWGKIKVTDDWNRIDNLSCALHSIVSYARIDFFSVPEVPIPTSRNFVGLSTDGFWHLGDFKDDGSPAEDGALFSIEDGFSAIVSGSMFE